MSSNCVPTINWCINSLSRTQHCSVSVAYNKESRLLHSASLFNPGSHVVFALLSLPVRPSLCLPHSPSSRLDLSSFHLVDLVLLIHCSARRTCWIMQIVTERQSSLEAAKTNSCVHLENKLCRVEKLYSFLENLAMDVNSVVEFAINTQKTNRQSPTCIHMVLDLPFFLTDDNSPTSLQHALLRSYVYFFLIFPDLLLTKLEHMHALSLWRFNVFTQYMQIFTYYILYKNTEYEAGQCKVNMI